MLSKVGIDSGCFISLRMNRIAGALIDLKQPDAARPGAVNHQHFSVLIIKDAGIDAVGVFLVVVLYSGQIWGGVSIGAHNSMEICFADGCFGKAGIDQRITIFIRTFHIICCCKMDHRSAVIMTGGKIHDPFSERFVINNIRRPHGIASICKFPYIFKCSHVRIK